MEAHDKYPNSENAMTRALEALSLECLSSTSNDTHPGDGSGDVAAISDYDKICEKNYRFTDLSFKDYARACGSKSLKDHMDDLCKDLDSGPFVIGSNNMSKTIRSYMDISKPDPHTCTLDWKSGFKMSKEDLLSHAKTLTEPTFDAIKINQDLKRYVKNQSLDQSSIKSYNDICGAVRDSLLSSLDNLETVKEIIDFVSFISYSYIPDLWRYLSACLGGKKDMSYIAKKLAKESDRKFYSENPAESARLKVIAGSWWRLSLAIDKDNLGLYEHRYFAFREIDLLNLDKSVEDTDIGVHPSRNPSFLEGAIEAGESGVASGDCVTVSKEFVPSDDHLIHAILQRFDRLTRPMPFSGSADPGKVYSHLSARFPWMPEANIMAAQVAALACASTHPTRLRLQCPIILLGLSGIGKSLWTRYLAEALGMKLSTLSVAGVNSPRLLIGTERGWGSASPCFPAIAINQHGVANPMLLIDEADKTASSDHNGSFLSSMLTITEPSTSKNYLDTCLLGEMDLSWTSWVMTVNSLDTMPTALLDRSLIINVTPPDESHFDLIFDLVLASYIADNSIRSEGMPDISNMKDAIRMEFLHTRSVRSVKKAVSRIAINRMWQPPQASQLSQPHLH